MIRETNKSEDQNLSFGKLQPETFHYQLESKNSIHDNKPVSKLSCAKDKQREVRPVTGLLTVITQFILLTIFITT